MKSITVHGLDDQVYERLKKRAAAEGRSLNRTAKAILGEAVGLGPTVTDHRQDFLDLFGTWSQRDLQEFQQATADLRRVDTTDWQ